MVQPDYMFELSIETFFDLEVQRLQAQNRNEITALIKDPQRAEHESVKLKLIPDFFLATDGTVDDSVFATCLAEEVLGGLGFSSTNKITDMTPTECVTFWEFRALDPQADEVSTFTVEERRPRRLPKGSLGVDVEVEKGRTIPYLKALQHHRPKNSKIKRDNLPIQDNSPLGRVVVSYEHYYEEEY